MGATVLWEIVSDFRGDVCCYIEKQVDNEKLDRLNNKISHMQ